MEKSINALEVKRVVGGFRGKDDLKAVSILFLDITLIISVFLLAIYTQSLILKIGLGVLQGLFIGLLFIVGHDCCHNSFTSSKRANVILGHLALLPTLHNYYLWELGHNQTHHSFTNLKSKDYVYCPLSPNEYRSLPFIKRMIYRLYRSGFGHGLYYGIEVWFKKILIPNSSIRRAKFERKYWLGSLIVGIYLIGVSALTFEILMANELPILQNMFLVLLFPFFVWNFAMGFIIYLQHTNPLIKWFSDEKEWHYWETQVGHSVHLHFPKPFNWVLHNIMEHTAHHSSMEIPLYNLPKAQLELERHFGDKIQVIDWSFKFYLNSIRECKLYDYEHGEWKRFRES